MKKLTYKGRYPTVSVGGASFVRGEETDVSDELFDVLVKDSEFSSAPAEAPKPVAQKPVPAPVPAK